MAKYVVVDPLVAEVMTVLKAIIFCKEMRFFDVIFEGDVLLVVKVIADTFPNFSRIDHFVDSSRIRDEISSLCLCSSRFSVVY
jgi:hypothetical protein